MKKGQAAMEFLMTYGWAILVVLAAIGALAYFGVLSPDKFMPSKCTMAAGFDCSEFKITATGVQMNMQNNLGIDLTAMNVTIVGQSPNECTAIYNATTINNGAKTDLQTYPCTITGKFKGDISVDYIKSGETVSHTSSGSVSGGVEQ